MASIFRIRRSDGVVVVSGLDATDANITIMDAPPSSGSYTYYLEVQGTGGSVSRVLSMLQALLVKK
jgi:hypothetical protein